MSSPDEKKRLLADIMAGEDGLREAMLGETLRHVRRRRQFRHATQACVVLLLAALVVVVLRNQTTTSTTPAQASKSYVNVSTERLSADSIVSSHPMPQDELVASAPHSGIVETLSQSDTVRIIGDDELLALAWPRQAALVRRSSGLVELVVVEEPDSQDSIPH